MGAGTDCTKWNFSQRGKSSQHVPLGQWKESLSKKKEKKSSMRDYASLMLSTESDAPLQVAPKSETAGGISFEQFLHYAAANSGMFTELYNEFNRR